MLEEVKQYLRVDGTDEDIQIQALIDAAEAYLINAGATKDETNPLYKLAVKLLVSHWYENRSALVIGSISKEMEFSLQSILTQLKNCYPLTLL